MPYLYAGGAVLAAVFLVAIAALTLFQVVGRLLGAAVPDAGELAGYAMAAAIFLSLAHTFRSGGHIRVNLLLTHVRPALRRALEYWCLALLAVLGGLFAWYAVGMVIDSYTMGDVSTGMLPVKLWIPQIGMAAGAILFELAVLEECLHVLRGNEPRYEQPADAEAAFTE
jgi:TRAP-type C4-dicarboxylate transport system permease small subunit